MKASAVTKLILIGEHAVLYGARAISLPIFKRTHIVLKKIGRKVTGLIDKNMRENNTIMDLKVGNLSFLIQSTEPINLNTVETLKKLLGVLINFVVKKGKQPVSKKIESIFEIKPGRGHGVSASISTALVKAFAKFYDIKISEKELFELVEKLENINHGKCSGLDHTTIIKETPILFKKGVKKNSFTEIPEILLSSIWKNVYLVDTGRPEESTREMVAKVAENSEKYTTLFDKLDELVDETVNSLTINDEKMFKNVLMKSGLILEKIGIVSEKVREFSKQVRSLGGSLKVSGAGGAKGASGMMILMGDEIKKIKKLVKSFGYSMKKLN